MSERPTTRARWATNANHAAGPDAWSGQPTKAAPALGKIATGRIPRELPPAEETNWWRDLMAQHFEWLAELRVRNFLEEADLSGLIINAGIFPSVSVGPYVFGDQGAQAIRVRTTRSGLIWVDFLGPNVGPASAGAFDMDESNARRLYVRNTPTDSVFYELAGVPTASFFPGAPGLTWTSCAGSPLVASPASEFMVGETLGSVHKSSDDGANFAVVAIPGLVGAIIAMAHSKDAQDVWMVATPTQIATSVDFGATWTVTLHGLTLSGTAQPMLLSHDPMYQRWVIATAGSTFAYSDDNGATWTPTNSAFEVPPSDTARRILGSKTGELIATAQVGVAGSLLSSSIDGGKTWSPIWSPKPLDRAVALACPVYTGGRFSLFAQATGGVICMCGIGT